MGHSLFVAFSRNAFPVLPFDFRETDILLEAFIARIVIILSKRDTTMKTKKQLVRWLCILAVIGASLSYSANSALAVIAPDLVFEANYRFDALGTSPVGNPPWVTAQFYNTSTPGTVELTLYTSNLTDNEFATEWDLNLDPTLDPTKLVFNLVGASTGLTIPTIGTKVDHFQADGDGKYDISFGFETSNASAGRFLPDKWITYSITTDEPNKTIAASSFDFLSKSAGGSGPFYMATHIQGISTGTGSGWVAPVPEPSTLILLGIASLGVLAGVWRKRSVG